MRKYEKVHIDYVKSIAKGRYNDEITDLFNEKFNTNKSVGAICSMKKNHNIVSGKLPYRPRPNIRIFTDEQEDFLKENVKGLYSNELAKLVNDEFDLNITESQIKSWKNRNKVTSGLTGHFEKGRESWNKGMKGLNTGGEKGWFKKGRQPNNYRPVGSERIDSKDGYIIVKVQDEGSFQDRWRHKHVVVWEKEHGKAPENHVIVFLDTNKENVTLHNLELLTRGELALMNKGNYFSTNPEITKAGISLVRFDSKLFGLEIHKGNEELFKEKMLLANSNGIETGTFMARIRRGWTMNQAANKPLNFRFSKGVI